MDNRKTWFYRRFAVGCCFLCIILSAGGFCGAADDVRKVGMVPLSCLGGVSSNEAAMLGESIKSKLAANSGIEIIDKKNVRAVMTQSNIDSSMDCSGVDCLADLGKKLDAAVMVSGSAGKIGELYELTLTVVDVSTKKRLFTKEYQYRGAIESFFTKTTGEAVDDIVLSLHNQPIKPQTVEIPPAKTFIVSPVEEVRIEDGFVPESQARVFQGPTFGAYGRLAVGGLVENQSRWGAGLFYAQPSTANGYIRIKLSTPISDNDSIRKNSSSKMPDVLTSVEHEWAWEHFGIGAGVACMYMHSFAMVDNSYGQYDPITGMYDYPGAIVQYNDKFAFDWVFDIRGGRTNKGFRGRIVWPMPWTGFYSSSTPANYFVEYSALGVFGGDYWKGAMGIQGMYKQRQSDGTSSPAYPGYYSQVDSYYTLVPCGKIAFRVGKQSVVCATLDLSGLFLPPLSTSSPPWAPNIQVNYTYSLRPLTGVDIGDGTF